ncbi:hypothetical protein BDZ88DRAFT_242345 [Geranomyces variabilis]|nr:hypothetical protein BDZ88DRAFT_242345 [Geranomyces variabilis]
MVFSIFLFFSGGWGAGRWGVGGSASRSMTELKIIIFLASLSFRLGFRDRRVTKCWHWQLRLFLCPPPASNTSESK